MYIYISKISIIRIQGQKLFNVSRSTVFWKKERGRNVSISRFRLRNFRSNILFPTRDRIFPLSRFRAQKSSSIEIFVLSRSSVARQDFSIIVRDKCRKVCVSEIKFLDFWSESVTIRLNFGRGRKTRTIAEKCTFRRKSFSRETRDNLRRLTIGKEMFGGISLKIHIEVLRDSLDSKFVVELKYFPSQLSQTRGRLFQDKERMREFSS